MDDSSIYSRGRVVATWSGATRLSSAPRGAAPRQRAALIQPSSTIAVAHDALVIAILDRDDSGMPAQVAFVRKEKDLAEAFAALPVVDQCALHARLSRVREGNTPTEKSNRLTAERRTRLSNLLSDARRCAAQRGK